VNHQLSCYEPVGEGTVYYVVCQNKVGYTSPKTFQNFPKMPPSRALIRAWYKQSKATGGVLHKNGAGRPVVSDENVKSICKVFIHSPHKVTQAAVCELQMLHSAVHQLWKHLCLYAYKVKVVQAITSDNRIACHHFALSMLEKLDEDNEFLRKSSSLMRLHSTFQGR
jgi:hypothetical protein